MAQQVYKFTFTTPSEFVAWVLSVKNDMVENGLTKIKRHEITQGQLQKKLDATRDLLNAGIAHAKTLGLPVDVATLK
jgi:hypothetical protein